jgi:threonine synthase
VAGTRKLVRQGVIQPHETVVSILTGNLLKDPDTTVAYHTGANQYANTPVKVEASFEAVRAAIEAVL